MDLANDGDLDSVTAEFNSPPQLLISDLAQRRKVHWLGVRLRGTASNRDGLGSRLVIAAGGSRQWRLHDGKSGYLTQSSAPLYIGLGEAEQVEGIEVRWPSGAVQTLAGPIAIDRVLEIVEPS